MARAASSSLENRTVPYPRDRPSSSDAIFRPRDGPDAGEKLLEGLPSGLPREVQHDDTLAADGSTLGPRRVSEAAPQRQRQRRRRPAAVAVRRPVGIIPTGPPGPLGGDPIIPPIPPIIPMGPPGPIPPMGGPPGPPGYPGIPPIIGDIVPGETHPRPHHAQLTVRVEPLKPTPLPIIVIPGPRIPPLAMV